MPEPRQLVGYQQYIVRVPVGQKIVAGDPATTTLETEITSTGRVVAHVVQVHAPLYLQGEPERLPDPPSDYQWTGTREFTEAEKESARVSKLKDGLKARGIPLE